MKRLLQQTNIFKNALVPLTFLAFVFLQSCKKGHDFPTLKITTVATGLGNPMGVETDRDGNVWVVQSGNGKIKGKVLVVTKDGKKYDAIINFESITTNGDTEGPSHLLFKNGLLYILGARGKMYIADVSGFEPGSTPIEASSLTVEDIGSFVLAYPFVNKTNETHTYNLTEGPGGDIYIVDAAANAIIHREGPGKYSVLAEVPGIPNPTTVGPPQIESVPTGIIYDGNNFYISTLLGFPFPPGQALVYKISRSGKVSVHQKGFTSLVDIEQGNYQGRLVLEYGTFGATGFAPNTGRLVWSNGTSVTQLAGGLNLPTGLKQVNNHTWYVTSMGDGTLLRVTNY